MYKYILAGLLLVVGCAPTAQWDKKYNDSLQNLVRTPQYTADIRTGMCFAYTVRPFSMTVVPCTDKVLQLVLENNPIES